MKRSFCGQDVIDAYARIADYVEETPLVHSMYLSNAQQNVYLKMNHYKVPRVLRSEDA